MKELYNDVCQECSELITKRYSTSFSLGIRLFEKSIRPEIYAIYGFVRFADEIVDTFHDMDQELLINEFEKETYIAIDRKISLNPVLQSFQKVVNEYDISVEYIDAFIKSMKMDLHKKAFTQEEYEKYIYGSAEVIGLMCLKVFVKDQIEFEALKGYARSLGSAFQKINFLRDMKSDFEERGRVYFPDISYHTFSQEDKRSIIEDIKHDFDLGYIGVTKLPSGVKKGVFTAYEYYTSLLKVIENTPKEKIFEKRFRISNFSKILIFIKNMYFSSVSR